MTFDRFGGRFLVEGRLVALTAVRVSDARRPAGAGTDCPVVRDSLDRPYLPGSSLKGALRVEVERLVRSVRPARACNPGGAEDEWCVSPDAWARLRERGATASAGPAGAGAEDALTDALVEASCWVCRLFGSPWLASRVQVADAPAAADGRSGRPEVRDGVAIDRDTGTSRPALRYDYEVIPAGTEFRFQLRADSDDPRLLGMLALGLRALEAGHLSVGGGRSRGLGQVRLATARRALVRRDPDSLLTYLAQGDQVATAVDDGMLAGWLAAFVDCLRADTLPREGR